MSLYLSEISCDALLSVFFFISLTHLNEKVHARLAAITFMLSMSSASFESLNWNRILLHPPVELNRTDSLSSVYTEMLKCSNVSFTCDSLESIWCTFFILKMSSCQSFGHFVGFIITLLLWSRATRLNTQKCFRLVLLNEITCYLLSCITRAR